METKAKRNPRGCISNISKLYDLASPVFMVSRSGWITDDPIGGRDRGEHETIAKKLGYENVSWDDMDEAHLDGAIRGAVRGNRDISLSSPNYEFVLTRVVRLLEAAVQPHAWIDIVITTDPKPKQFPYTFPYISFSGTPQEAIRAVREYMRSDTSHWMNEAARDALGGQLALRAA